MREVVTSPWEISGSRLLSSVCNQFPMMAREVFIKVNLGSQIYACSLAWGVS